jgi:hypothetical protein
MSARHENREDFFAQLVVKPRAFDESEIAFLREFAERSAVRQRPGILLRYLPDRSIESHYTDVVAAWEPSAVPILDDRPFAVRSASALARVRGQAAQSVAVIAALLAICALTFGHRGGASAGSIGFRGFAAVALAGLGYVLLETALIQRLQLLFGAPGLSLAVVLGSMLVATGLGGWTLASRRVGPGLFLVPFVASLWLAWAVSGSAPALLAGAGLPWKVGMVVVGVGPLAFVLGLFLPTLVRGVVLAGSAEAGPALFGASAGAGALATPIALVVALERGFSVVFLLGAACYVLAAAGLPRGSGLREEGPP